MHLDMLMNVMECIPGPENGGRMNKLLSQVFQKILFNPGKEDGMEKKV